MLAGVAGLIAPVMRERGGEKLRKFERNAPAEQLNRSLSAWYRFPLIPPDLLLMKTPANWSRLKRKTGEGNLLSHRAG